MTTPIRTAGSAAAPACVMATLSQMGWAIFRDFQVVANAWLQP